MSPRASRRPARKARGSHRQSTRHASRRVEIAANNGHNRASLAPIPIMTLTFEDFPPGHFGSFGPRRVTREEILAFAAEFDPQPMHLDEEAAKRSMLQGLSGSGWHLCSIMMRMMFDGYIGRTASLGSPGLNELRWLAPLRPGDELTIDVDVAEARGARSIGLACRIGVHEAAGGRWRAPGQRGSRGRRGDRGLGTVAGFS